MGAELLLDTRLTSSQAVTLMWSSGSSSLCSGLWGMNSFLKKTLFRKAVVFLYVFRFDRMLLKIKSFPPLIFHLKKEYKGWIFPLSKYQLPGGSHSSVFRRTKIIGVAQASGQHWVYLCLVQGKKEKQHSQFNMSLHLDCLVQLSQWTLRWWLCTGGLLHLLLPLGVSLTSHHLAH